MYMLLLSRSHAFCHQIPWENLFFGECFHYWFSIYFCSRCMLFSFTKKKKKKSPNDSCVNNNNKHVSNDAFILMLKFFLHAFKSFRIVLLSSNRMHVYICKLWSMEGTERKYIAKYLLSNFISHKMADNIILYIKQTVLFQKKRKTRCCRLFRFSLSFFYYNSQPRNDMFFHNMLLFPSFFIIASYSWFSFFSLSVSLNFARKFSVWCGMDS